MSARPDYAYRAAIGAALVAASPDACPVSMDPRQARRFRIYRNNVHRALRDALADAYPIVRRLVGDEFFFAMAREFFLSERTRAPSLALYGAAFPQFVASFPPAASVPYLADVARLERAWLEALHARDAMALSASSLPGDGRQLASTRLSAHPATRLVASAHPIVSIWHAHRTDPAAETIVDAAEHALVTRPHLEVQVTPLNDGAGWFVRRLLDGVSVEQAYSETTAMRATVDVTATFARLLEVGAFTQDSPNGISETDHEHD